MTLETALNGLNDQLRGALPPELAEILDADRRRAATDFAEVGAKIEDFTLPGADGTPTGLAELVADGPAVLVFYRGQWCPYCNLTLRTYQQELLPELGKLGATLVAVSPQRPDGSVPEGLAFPALSDAGSAVARRLGLSYPVSTPVRDAMVTLGTDLEQVNGTWELVHPAVLVVDRDRVLRFVDVHPDFVTRTEPADILEAVKSL